MEIERRAFLRCAAAVALTLAGPILPRAFAAGAGRRYLSACRRSDGTWAVAEFDPDGFVIRTLPLADRGHSFALASDRSRAVAFARSPGTTAIAFSTTGGEPVAFFAPAGRHFYGHGVFVDRDRLLLATENDYDNARGTIGIYDATGSYERIGEFACGVGPHEVVLMPDGRTIAIGVGGIETHPDAGEAKLNLATMMPSLLFLDGATGDVLTEHRLPPALNRLSIRHLAVDARGAVWFGCQYEGAAADQPPLLGRAGPDRPPVMVDEGADVRLGLRNYVGSVAASADGTIIAASSPRGGQVMLVDLSGRVVGVTALPDGCGLAPRDDGFVATSGEGAIVAIGTDGRRSDLANGRVAFDNHVAVILPA